MGLPLLLEGNAVCRLWHGATRCGTAFGVLKGDAEFADGLGLRCLRRAESASAWYPEHKGCHALRKEYDNLTALPIIRGHIQT